MSLTSQITELNDVQLHSLHNTMLDACTALELGGDWREIFRRAKNRHVGRMHRIYDLLYHAKSHEIDRAARHLVEIL